MTIRLARSHLFLALIILVGACFAAIADATGHTSLLMMVGFLTGSFFSDVRNKMTEPTPK